MQMSLLSFSFLLKLHLILSEIVNSPYCGKSVHQEKLTYHKKIQNRIVGGWKAYDGSLPWMVHLTFPAEEGFSQMCGGSLISLDGKNSTCLVLTAAHCVKLGNRYKEPGDILVAIRQNHLKHARNEAIFFHVKNYVSHFFHEDSLENDIAILRLEKWVLFTKYVRPLCLPSANMRLPIGEECYAAGWGRTNVEKEEGMLKIVKMRLQMSKFCPRPFIQEKMLCAGNLGGGHDVCNGDSGGPLFCMVGDRFYLFGIVSFGYNDCALQGASSAFVRVTSYLDWIEKTAITLKNIKINNRRNGTAEIINSHYCGKSVYQNKLKNLPSQNRIVGGWNSYPGSIPWMVFLVFPQDESYIQSCGGTLISIDGENRTSLVLTAAHCLMMNAIVFSNKYKQPGNINVAVGQYNVKRAEPEALFLSVKNYVSHFYHNTSFENDVAILKLGMPVVFTDHIRPVCLPKVNMELPSDADCYASGWGKTYEEDHGYLKVVQVKLQDAFFCPKEYRSDNMICAGNLEGGHSICQGDSGGPLFCLIDDRFYQIGIASFSYVACDLPNTAAVFVRVNTYLEWIEMAGRKLSLSKIKNTKRETYSSIYLPKIQSTVANSLLAKAYQSPFEKSPSRLIAAMGVHAYLHKCCSGKLLRHTFVMNTDVHAHLPPYLMNIYILTFFIFCAFAKDDIVTNDFQESSESQNLTITDESVVVASVRFNAFDMAKETLYNQEKSKSQGFFHRVLKLEHTSQNRVLTYVNFIAAETSCSVQEKISVEEVYSKQCSPTFPRKLFDCEGTLWHYRANSSAALKRHDKLFMLFSKYIIYSMTDFSDFKGALNFGKFYVHIEMDMTGRAYGAGMAGSEINWRKAIQNPRCILRAVCMLFAIIVFGSISSRAWYKNPGGDVICLFGESNFSCTLGNGLGILSFLMCIGMIVSGIVTFLWFIAFCTLANKWSSMKLTDAMKVAASPCEAAIAFSFFSTISWAGLAFLGWKRYKEGAESAFAPTYDQDFSASPYTYPTGYAEEPYQQSTFPGSTQSTFAPTNFEAPYQPPTY
ncbi:Transmembrane protease serine 9 [Trichinella murrelli]|uniref:Acrosin n=1 Tax=Trichinella murrelli TaxID=144512 RepID=A0A0V0TSK9_9BILA|nr:Transmembrane protease serine 9 [Trichinella murrelli]